MNNIIVWYALGHVVSIYFYLKIVSVSRQTDNKLIYYDNRVENL